MPTILDTLLLEVDLDPSRYAAKIGQLRTDAMASAKEVESVFKSVNATLSAKVDDRALTALNKHLDLKQAHFAQVRRDFQQNPLKPRVDFKDLDNLERRLNRLKSGSFNVNISASGGTSSGSHQQMADAIGRAVAKHSRPSTVSRIVGGVANAATAPIRAALAIPSQVISQSAQGIAFGVANEVSKNLGKGLSTALESAVSRSFGSTELIGEKLGGAVGAAVVDAFGDRIKSIPDLLEKAIDRIQSPKKRAELKKMLATIQEVPGVVRKQAVDTLGGEAAVAQEGMAVRQSQRKRKQAKKPATQEGAATEWRDALWNRDLVNAEAGDRRTANDKQRAILQRQGQEAQKAFADLNKQLEEAKATGDKELEAETNKAIAQVSAIAMGTVEAIEQLEKLDTEIAKESQKADERVKQAYARYQSVMPRQRPKSYEDLFSQATKGAVSQEKMPVLRVADTKLKKIGAKAQYDVARNAIEVTRETYDAIVSGTLTNAQRETLLEELNHAVDFDFGSFKGMQAAKSRRVVGKPVTPTAEEFAKLAPELGLYSPDRRALELNAKVKAMRDLDAVSQSSRQAKNLELVPEVAVNKLKIERQRKLFDAQLGWLDEQGAAKGVDVSGFVGKYRELFDDLDSKITGLVSSVTEAGLDADPAEVEAAIKKMEAYWSTLETLNTKLQERIKLTAQGVGPKPESASLARTTQAIAQQSGEGKTVRERVNDVAYQAGAIAGNAAGAMRSVIGSPQVQAIGKFTVGVYKASEAIESLVLDLVPFGRIAKGTIKNVAAPMAMYGAATHLLPGGAALGEAITHTAQMGLTPIGNMVSGGMMDAASATISHLPGAFGIQQAVSGAVSAGIESLTQAGTAAIASVGTALIGGKAMQNAAAMPLKAIAPGSALQLQSAQQKALPGSNAAAALTLTSPTTLNEAKTKAVEAAYKAGQMAGEAIANVQELIDAGNALVGNVSSAYANLKDAIKTAEKAMKTGDQGAIAETQRNVKAYEEAFQETKEHVLGRINDLLEFARDAGEAQFGAKGLSALGGIKGRITQQFNRAEQQTRKFKNKAGIADDAIDVPSVAAQPKEVRPVPVNLPEARPIVDLSTEYEALGEDLWAQKLSLESFGDALDKARQGLEDFLATTYDVEAQGSVMGTAKAALQTPKAREQIKDLAVNAGGMAASAAMGHQGNLAGIAGDISGALITRQLIELGIALKKAKQNLDQSLASGDMSGLDKFKLLMTSLNNELQSKAFELNQKDAIFGDITGFAVGNAAAQLPNVLQAAGVPGAGAVGKLPVGAIAASLSVDSLRKLRDQIADAVSQGASEGLDESLGEDLAAQSLDLSKRGLKPRRGMNDAEKAYYQDLIRVIDDAIAKADQFDKAYAAADPQVQQRLDESRKKLQAQIDPDPQGIIQQVQSTIEEYEKVIAELEAGYNERINKSQEKVAEDLEYRKAYAELMGKDPDLGAIEAPPMPKENKFFEALKGDIGEIIKGTKSLGSALTGLIPAAAGLGAIVAFGPQLWDLGKSSIEAAMDMQQLERTVMFASGSFQQGQKNLAMLRDEANRLGVDLKNSMEGFAGFANATRGTSLEGAATEQINKAIQEGAAISQLTGQQTDRLYKVFRDIAGKGQVYSEELVGQLAEVGGVFSGGLQIAARSYGINSQQLRKRMSRGEIKSEDFLPRFAQQLSAETATSVESSANSAQASVNRLNNAIFELQAAIGKQLLPVRNMGLDMLTKALQATMVVLPPFIQLLSSAAIAAITRYAAALVTAGGAKMGFVTITKLAGVAIKSFIGLMKSSALSTAGLTVGLFGAIELFKLFKSVQEDAGGAAKDFAEQSRKSLEEYLRLTGQAIDKTKELADAQRNNAPSASEGGILGTLAQSIFGDAGTQFLRNAETGIQRRLGLSTLADKKASDVLVNSREGRFNTDQLLGQAQQMFGRGGNAQGQLRQLMDIDARIQQERDRRATIDPGNESDVRASQAREQELLAAREEAVKAVALLQKSFAERVESIKAAQDRIQQALDEGNLTPEDTAALRTEYDQLGRQLEDVKTMQDRFNKAMSQGLQINQQLQRSFDKIADSISDANQALSIQEAKSRQTLANLQTTTNLTPGQLQGMQNTNAIQGSVNRIAVNQQARSGLQSLYDSPAIQEALSAAGLSSDSGVAEIRRRIDSIGESLTTETRDRLTMAADARERMQQLDLETAGMAADIAETQAQAAQAMRDLNKEIKDYLKEVQRAAEDLAQTTKRTNFQVAIQDAKSRISTALGDYSDNFFSGIIDALDQALQAIFKIPQNWLDLTEQITQINRTFQDGQQNLSNLQGQAIPQGTITTPGDANSGSGGGFFSPLRGRSVQELVNYQESEDQGWRATRHRRSGVGVHGGIDFGRNIGGVPGAEVVAMESGNATIRQIATAEGTGEGSMQIRIEFVDEQGRPITLEYNHLAESAVRQALGRTSGTVPVNAGQVIGRIGQDDTISSGAHLDTKIRINGEFVDPQQYIQARGGSGGMVTTLSGRQVRVNAAGGAQLTPQPTRSPASAPTGQQYRPRAGTARTAESVQRDPAGAAAIVASAQRLQLDPVQLAALMSWESAGTLNPNVMGGDGGQYRGLIQFSPSNQRQYGINGNMSIAEQMPAVERYLLDRGFVPGQMDIRGAYSAVLAGNANQRYWNRTDSNGTSVNNAAGRFRSGEHYDRAARFLQNSNVDPRNPGAIASTSSSTGTGVPGAQLLPGVPLDTTSLNASSEGLRANAQAASANAYANFNSNNRAAVAEAVGILDRVSTQIRQNSRSQADAVRQAQQAVDDAFAEGRADTSENRYQEALRRVTQEESQRATELSRNIEDSTRSLEQLRLNRSLMQEELNKAQQLVADNPALREQMAPAIQKFNETLSEIDGLIAETETNIGKLQEAADQAPIASMAKRKKLYNDRQREIANERFAQSSRLIQGDMGITQAAIEGMQIRGEEVRPAQRGLQAQQIMFDYRSQIRDIDNMEASMEITAETAAKLREQLGQLRDVQLSNLAAQAEVDRRAMEEEAYQERRRVTDSSMTLGQAIIDQRKARGQDTRQGEREMAIASQQLDFQSGLREIQQLQDTMQISATTAAQLRDNLSQINSVKLDTINSQFDVFSSQVLPELQGATQNLFSGLINGSMNLESILDNLLSSLANIAAQLLTQELFGNFMGGGNSGFGGGILGAVAGGGKNFGALAGGGGGKSSGWMDIAGLFLNAAVGGFADGGVVGSANHSNYKQGYGEISKALQREGPNGVLAALTPGELVLNNRETRRFFDLGLDKVLNFKEGGVVGGAGKSPVTVQAAPQMGGGINVSIPINNEFKGQGQGQDNPINSQRLESVVRNLVISELENQTRYRGIVRR
jgi:hypothetical protein